jgi:hypothetical protein
MPASFFSISSRSLAAAGVLVAAMACRAPQSPVARLEVSPPELELSYSRAVTLRFAWRLSRPIGSSSERATVFVHLYDHPRSVARTFDHPFPEPWVVGSLVEYEITLHQSILGPPLPSGPYWVSAGLYTSDGRRWPVEATGDEVNDYEYRVARVNVSEGAASPAVAFSSSWSEIRAGFDRQVLGRRLLLSTRGTLRLDPASSKGSLFLAVLPVGGAPPRVESTCRAPASRSWGFGTYELEIPVSATESCEVSVEAEPAGLSLEALAWKAAQ